MIFIDIPIIAKHPSSKKFRNRDKAVTTLTCEATGPGVITYQWEKYQSTYNLWTKISSRIVYSKSPNLTFSIITEKDEGVYRCNISNYDGSVISGNATITVYGEFKQRFPAHCAEKSAVCTKVLNSILSLQDVQVHSVY